MTDSNAAQVAPRAKKRATKPRATKAKPASRVEAAAAATAPQTAAAAPRQVLSASRSAPHHIKEIPVVRVSEEAWNHLALGRLIQFAHAFH